jgi:hypothetical protein
MYIFIERESEREWHSERLRCYYFLHDHDAADANADADRKTSQTVEMKKIVIAARVADGGREY